MASSEMPMMDAPAQEQQEQGAEKRPETPDQATETQDPDQKALEEIGHGRQELVGLQQRAELAGEKAKETSESIKEIRSELGLPAAETLSETEKALLDIERRIGDKDAALGAKETEFLGVPEGESEPMSASEQMLDIAEEAEMELQKEKESMEKRQKVAEDFINKTDGWVDANFGTYFKEAVNGKKAEQLMRLKIKAGVGFAAAKYIEEGGKDNLKELGYVAGLSIDKIKDEDGVEHPFI